MKLAERIIGGILFFAALVFGVFFVWSLLNSISYIKELIDSGTIVLTDETTMKDIISYYFSSVGPSFFYALSFFVFGWLIFFRTAACKSAVSQCFSPALSCDDQEVPCCCAGHDRQEEAQWFEDVSDELAAQDPAEQPPEQAPEETTEQAPE